MGLGAAIKLPWLFGWPICTTVSIIFVLMSSSQVSAGPRDFAHLTAKKSIAAPDGFKGLCGSHGWVCARSGANAVGGAGVLKLADRINRSVNRQTRQISDRAQYRKDEVWALPTKRGGDCEDLVLLKKLRLLEAGIPASALLIATVLDLKAGRHAVLVLRTTSGDLVLDSLDNRIRHWVDTNYTFLKLQNPRNPSTWDAIFAGGRIPIGSAPVVAMR